LIPVNASYSCFAEIWFLPEGSWLSWHLQSDTSLYRFILSRKENRWPDPSFHLRMGDPYPSYKSVRKLRHCLQDFANCRYRTSNISYTYVLNADSQIHSIIHGQQTDILPKYWFIFVKNLGPIFSKCLILTPLIHTIFSKITIPLLCADLE